MNDYWIVCVYGTVSVFGIQYGYRILKAFMIFIAKRIVNGYWIVSVFEIY